MPILPGTLAPVGCNAPACYWTIKVADFSFRADSVPSISNIQTIEPPSNFFYEAYGFSNDDSRIIFCSNLNKHSFFDENIYTIDVSGSNMTQLTSSDYNEHSWFTPDGKTFVGGRQVSLTTKEGEIMKVVLP
jgi:hypothetical protein